MVPPPPQTAWLCPPPPPPAATPPSSFLAEAVSFVNLVFLPLSMSGSCNETCHLEMTPSPPPRDASTQPQLPPHLLTHSFDNTSAGPAWCWPCPSSQGPGPSFCPLPSSSSQSGKRHGHKPRSKIPVRVRAAAQGWRQLQGPGREKQPLCALGALGPGRSPSRMCQPEAGVERGKAQM